MIQIAYSELTKRYYFLPLKENKIDITDDIKEIIAAHQPPAAQSDQEELQQLRAWKAEAMQIMPDFQEIGKLIGVPLAKSVHDKIIPYLKAQQQVDAVALLRMGVDLVDRAYEHSTEESTEWIAKAHQFVTEARTFFTARHPTPKTGSQGIKK